MKEKLKAAIKDQNHIVQNFRNIIAIYSLRNEPCVSVLDIEVSVEDAEEGKIDAIDDQIDSKGEK